MNFTESEDKMKKPKKPEPPPPRYERDMSGECLGILFLSAIFLTILLIYLKG